MPTNKDILSKYGLSENGKKAQVKAAPLPVANDNDTVSDIAAKYGLQTDLSLPVPTLGERITKTASGGAKRSAEGYVGALNFLTNVEADYQAAREKAGIPAGGYKEGRVWGSEPTAESAREQTEQTKAFDDRIRSSAEADVARAKEGLGAVGNVLVDLGAQGVQQTGDAVLGALTGIGGLPFMLTRVFGQGVQEAQDSGAGIGKQLAYGVGSAAVEGATERMFGLGSKWAYGKGASDELLKEIVNRAKTSAPVKKALTVAAAAAGESIEEFVSGIVNPALKSIYNGESFGQNYKDMDPADIGYDMLIGGLMGAIGGTGEVVRDTVQARRTNRQGAQAEQETASAERETAQAERDISLPTVQNDAAEARETADMRLPSVDEMNARQNAAQSASKAMNEEPTATPLPGVANSQTFGNLDGEQDLSLPKIKDAQSETVERLSDVLPQGEAVETPQDAYNAAQRGYPVINGTQIVPYKSYVRATDNGRNNYGLVVGLGNITDGKPTLLVDFWNKSEGTRVTKSVKYSDVKPVQGRYSREAGDLASIDLTAETAMQNGTVDPAILNLPSEEDVRERMGWNDRETEAWQLDREALPKNAARYLRRVEGGMFRKLQDALEANRFTDRPDIQEGVVELSREYLANGRISDESIDRIFDKAYDTGIRNDRDFYDENRDLKDRIRKTKIKLSDEVLSDMPDISDFRRAAFGTLNIGKDGTPIDVFYEELRDMNPTLFPEMQAQSDKLNRIYDVAHSIRIAERSIEEQDTDGSFRSWARNDFYNAVQDSVAELRRVARYAAEKESGKAPEAVTAETVEKAYQEIKGARRAMERAEARNLLTDSDKWNVDRLIKGYITMEELQATDANLKGIKEVYEAKLAYNRLARVIAEYNNRRKAELRETADYYLQSANNWKDKNSGFAYMRETMDRNLRDIIGDEAIADSIYYQYFLPVHLSEAESSRFKDKYRERVKELNLSRKVAKGNTVSEAYATQLLGEAQDNIAALEKSTDPKAARDGKTLEEWRAAVQELREQNPNMNWGKIENAVAEFRQIYDELYQEMNAVRTRNGYEPVDYRRGYFPHFQAGDADGLVASFAKALGIDTENITLPTSINGMTHTFRPGIRWFGNAQQRTGFNTEYDAVEGFDRYIEGVSDVIHQTDNIQQLRALAQQIRYRTTDDGIREQIDAIRNNADLDELTKEAELQKVYEDGKFTLSNFVNELDEYINLLANKKSRLDRGVEMLSNRKVYTFLKNLESRLGANMVAGNMGSALTNFIPLHQAAGTIESKYLLKGMLDTLRAYQNDDGFWHRSDFLTNRRGSDPLVRSWTRKAADVLSAPMLFIDQFTADSIVRARYAQNIAQGESETLAMDDADRWAARVMADRSKGSIPTIFASKNPVVKLFTQFQLEVNNELSYLFKDVPRELKDKGLGALAVGLLKYLLGAYIFNDVYEYFVGRRAALDPVGLLNKTAGDLTGYKLPNVVKGLTGREGFETEKKGLYDASTDLAKSAAEELPFVGGVLGGGRVPISSALPSLPKLWQAATDENWDARKKRSTALGELKKPLYYLAPPFGGGQLKKIFEGISTVERGGSYSVDSSGNDILQYAVPNDTAGEKAGAYAKALLFGKSSLEGAQEWVNSGFKSFSAKETAVYQGLNEAGVSDRDALALISELQSAQKTDDESAATVKRDVLRNAHISGEGKAVAYYGMLASDKERELMDELGDSTNMGAITQAIMDVKDANTNGGDKRLAVLNADLDDNATRMLYTRMVNQSDGVDDLLDELGIDGIGVRDWIEFEDRTAGLKKAQKLDAIDNMNLSQQQKDAMYLAAGYKESGLDDAPWNQASYEQQRTGASALSLKLPSLSLPELTLKLS